MCLKYKQNIGNIISCENIYIYTLPNPSLSGVTALMALKRAHDGNVRRTRAKQTHHDAGACPGCEHGWRFGRVCLQINARVRCKQPQPLDYVARRLSPHRCQRNWRLLTVMAYSNRYSWIGRSFVIHPVWFKANVGCINTYYGISG